MKKKVVVFETDPGVFEFLKTFFKGKSEYSVSFVRGERSALIRTIARREPDVLIISSPEGLKHIHPSEVKCPILGIVSTDQTKGIRSVVDSDVECYLLSPFHKDELDIKLRLATREHSWFDILDRDKENLHAVLELTNLVSSTLNPKKVLDIIVKKISRTISLKRCSFFSIGIGKQRYAEVISSSDLAGTQVGDIVLREFAQLVKRHTRKSDIFARYGGEEFIMLLPQTSRKGARKEAERIRKAVSEHSFCTEKNSVSITVSVGVASLPHAKIKNHDDLIHCADAAMFGAKKKGRNMVNVFPAT